MEMFQEPPKMKDPGAPTVIIVGAGLAGLTLAILLEKAKIEYLIFEKASEVKPLGRYLPPFLLFIVSVTVKAEGGLIFFLGRSFVNLIFSNYFLCP